MDDRERDVAVAAAAAAAEVVPFLDSFDTARLRAERLTAEHYDAIRAMDSDAEYMALLGGPRDMAETLAYMAKNLQHWADHGFGLWILRDTADGRVAGRCVLRHLDVEGTDEVELGYGFHQEYWGRGLATEVARRLLQFGLKELKLSSVVAITRPANVGSQRVLIKTGLVFEREVSYDGVPHVLYRSAP